MDKFFEYSIESAISLAVFYLFYWAFLRKTTHFRLNRFIVMLSVIGSIAIPPLANEINMPKAENLIMSINFPAQPELETAAPSESTLKKSHSLLEVIGFIYLMGAAVVLGRLIYQAIYLHAVSKLSKTTVHQGFKIISLDTDMIPFSYFNRIFIPANRINEDSLDSVITHEKSHFSQGHYYDLFIIQIVTVFQWFNPFIWLFEKSLKEVHEYLADEAVLDAGKDKGNYQAILVNEALGGPVFILTNQLNKSLIKKRILMMKNVKTPKIAQLKALLMLPLLVGLLLAFANPSLVSQTVTENNIIKGTITSRLSGDPIPGAMILIKGTTTGTISDGQGNYELMVNSQSDELVVTFAGYRSQQIPVGNNTRINVLLEPDIVAIDFNQGNKFVLEGRSDKDHPGNSESEREYLFIEERMPAYPGGTVALHKFIQENLQYPADAKNAGSEGTVLVTYIIDEKGQVTNPKIIRGVRLDIDKEALRVTKLIEGWKPASQNGRPVPTTVTMPVEFRLK